MKDILLNNRHFTIRLDTHTAGIASLSHPSDRHRMNWICHCDEQPWFPAGFGWGLGFLCMPTDGLPLLRWQRPEKQISSKNSAQCLYHAGAIAVTVARRLRGKFLDETYVLRNCSGSEVTIWGVGIYLPFNDNYPNATTCVTRRCNAHLWCGGSVSWACALRMGGEPPHLGLVVTEGDFSGYSIEGRGLGMGGSNVRGAIVFNHTGFTLGKGASRRIAWSLFWHQGWEDFFARAQTFPGFVRCQAQALTVARGRRLEIRSVGLPAKARIYVGKRKFKLRVHQGRGEANLSVHKPGEVEVRFDLGGGRHTLLRAYVTESVSKLLQARARFIAEKQQWRDPESPLYGAYLPYDNFLDKISINPSWADMGEGRERLAMGVLLAQVLQRWPDPGLRDSLDLYHRFVMTKLQLKDGAVRGAIAGAPNRLYDFPWVAHFHLEMFRLAQDIRHLKNFVRTMTAYYRRGGNKFYAIGIPMLDSVRALAEAGLQQEAAKMRQAFIQHAERILANGFDIPRHEVNYEQTIVGPAAIILLEVYLLTQRQEFLAGARRQLTALEMFNGRQPDHHLYEIAIRHWDGFWFSRSSKWGDTMPHYWSALTGHAYYRWWQATGEEEYRRRARAVLMNNLSAFTPDGRASCAYLYPDLINGDRGGFWDALANDQDWALVYLLEGSRIDPEFEKDCW